MKKEKALETDFDFFKKKEILEKDNYLNQFNLDGLIAKFISPPKGMWAVLIIALSLISLANNVEYAGWVMFIGVLQLGRRQGWKIFALCLLAMIGLYFHIPFSGWLIFIAFFVD